MSGLMGLFTLENITKLGLVSIQSLLVEEVFYSLISIESQGVAEVDNVLSLRYIIYTR